MYFFFDKKKADFFFGLQRAKPQKKRNYKVTKPEKETLIDQKEKETLYNHQLTLAEPICISNLL